MGAKARGELENSGERNIAAMPGKPFKMTDRGRILSGTLKASLNNKPVSD